MRLQVWIVLLSVAPAALSWPSEKYVRPPMREVRRYMNTNDNDENCQELAATAGEMSRNLAGAITMAVDMGPGFDEEFMREELRRIFGFDYVSDDEQRQAYTCDITQATTVSELKATLDAKDFHLNCFTNLYDVMTAALPVLKQNAASAYLNLLNALESVGLTSLDPEGTTWMGTTIYGEYYALLTSQCEVKLLQVNNKVKCCYIADAVETVMGSDNVHWFVQWIVVDMDHIKPLICDIIDAAGGGLEVVYDVIDNQHIINKFYRHMYPLAKRLVAQSITQVENLIDMKNQNFSEETLAPNVVEILESVLRFLQSLQNSGLLDLPNDISKD